METNKIAWTRILSEHTSLTRVHTMAESVGQSGHDD